VFLGHREVIEGTSLAENTSNLTIASFGDELRRALHVLYDPVQLAKSPLLDWLCLRKNEDPPAALRRLLLQAIESLRPADDVPPQTNAWRIYRILLHRYVEQIPQREIADSMALSVRQLRRQQKAALKVLTDYLWAQQGLALRATRSETAPEAQSPDNTPADNENSRADADTWRREYEWLRESLPSSSADVAQVLQGILSTVAPLLQASRVRVNCALPEDLPRVAAQTVTLRQVLANVLSTAARHIPNGHITIRAQAQDVHVIISVCLSHKGASPIPLGRHDLANLEMASQLAELSSGAIEFAFDPNREYLQNAVLQLPVAEQLAVLFIDDNADALRLFQRYLEDTRYPFLGARSPQEALELATNLNPKIIVMDVMLPDMDGWELLGHLREHPATRHIPVIVCTVLHQEQLALTLGAAAFMHKPVSRMELLSTLEALAAQLPPDTR
jgi:CheY-like chemotaxis protein